MGVKGVHVAHMELVQVPAVQACQPLLPACVPVMQLARCSSLSYQKLEHWRNMPARTQVSGSLDNVGGLVLQRRLVRDPSVSICVSMHAMQ